MVDGLPDILPSLPIDAPYTQNYCEENIYLLAQHFEQQTHVRDVWDISVVFISNHTKSVSIEQPSLDYSSSTLHHELLIVCGTVSSTTGRTVHAESCDKSCRCMGLSCDLNPAPQNLWHECRFGGSRVPSRRRSQQHYYWRILDL